MLWFNVDKGHGFIRTEDDERLYVARDGFAADVELAAPCKGRAVTFDREMVDSDPHAVNVAFSEQHEPRRARLRKGRGSSSL
jgi:cold shock CspA family protein